MLFMCVSFLQLYKSSRLFRKGAEKEIRNTFRELAIDRADAYGDAGREACRLEMRNAAARYFKTCEHPGFNRRFFGLTASGDEGKRNRMCRDAWQMSEGLAERTGLQQEMAGWNRAVLEAYSAAEPDGQNRLREYRRQNGK